MNGTYFVQVALGTSSLWSKHDNVLNTPVEYLPAILSRAGKLSLDLSLEFQPVTQGSDHESESSSPSEEAREGLRAREWLSRPVCLRTSRLCMRGVGDVSLRETLDLAAPYLGGLRKLYLHWAHSRDIAELPKHIADLAELEELCLEGFYASWRSPIFSGTLGYLKMELKYRNGSIHYHGDDHTCERFQDMLNTMRSLHILILVNFLPSDIREETNTFTPPPSLRFFRFQAHHRSLFSKSLRLLKRLRLPDTCCRSADLRHDKDTTPAYVGHCLQDFLSFSPRHIRESKATLSRKSITIRSTDKSILTTPSSFSRQDHVLFDLTHRTPPGSIYISVRISGLHVYTYLSDLHTDKLRACAFTRGVCEEYGRLERWGTIGAATPHIRRIAVCFLECLPLLRALEHKTGEGFALFPQLQEITLYGPEMDDLTNATFDEHRTAMENLLDVRQEAAMPLKYMTSRRTSKDGLGGLVTSYVPFVY